MCVIVSSSGSAKGGDEFDVIGYLARKLDTAYLTDVVAYFRCVFIVMCTALSLWVAEIEEWATSLLEMK